MAEPYQKDIHAHLEQRESREHFQSEASGNQRPHLDAMVKNPSLKQDGAEDLKQMKDTNRRGSELNSVPNSPDKSERGSRVSRRGEKFSRHNSFLEGDSQWDAESSLYSAFDGKS